MSEFQIFIEDGVEIPKRELVGRPRESIYPIDQMRQGQGFYLPVYGEEGQTKTARDGTVTQLTPEEDWQRKVRQKQSYFSQLGKKHGVKIITRVFEDGAQFSARNAGVPGIGVWHGGPRDGTEEELPEVED